MPKITNDRIEFVPDDRTAISEQSVGITASGYSTLFSEAATDGETTRYFKFLEEIKEKDPDILQAIETRTSYITSKEWEVLNEDGEEDENTAKITEALRAIAGDQVEGLLTVDELIRSMLGASYLTGLSFAEIVSDGEQITGFSPIPCHFLTFKSSVYYPKLWTRDNNSGIDFNREKMISHFLTRGNDPARGWLGNGVAWQYVWKRTTMDEKLRFEKKYGKGFLTILMPGDRDSFTADWAAAEDLAENMSTTDAAVFGSQVEIDFQESAQSEGDYFFQSEDQYKTDIVKIILGQESTSSAESANRSIGDVHMEVLEKRILEDSAAIEDTLTSQLISKVKALLSIGEDKTYEFKFVISEMEETLDEELDGEGATEDADSPKVETDKEEVATDE